MGGEGKGKGAFSRSFQLLYYIGLLNKLSPSKEKNSIFYLKGKNIHFIDKCLNQRYYRSPVKCEYMILNSDLKRFYHENNNRKKSHLIL